MIAVATVIGAIALFGLMGPPSSVSDAPPVSRPLTLCFLFALQALTIHGLGGSDRASAWTTPVWAVTVSAMALILLLDVATPGVPLIILGMCCNLAVVLLNGAMPVMELASKTWTYSGGFYRPMQASDMGRLLADVLPVPGGWVVSVGDLLIFVGALALMFVPRDGGCDERTMRTRRQR